MIKPKLIRITTVTMSLELLLKGQLEFMQNHFVVTGISAEKEKLAALGLERGYNTHHIEMTRKITPIADLKAVYQLYRYLKKEKPSIVHTHTPKAGIVGMLAAWMANVPNRLHTVAGLPLMEANGMNRKVLNFVERRTYNFATKVYPNSKGLYDFIVAEKLAKPKKLKIIGKGSTNGVNTQHFDALHFTNDNERLRQSLNISEDSFVFVLVGRLVGDKGINELVSAFKDIANLNSGIKSSLILVGPLETERDPLQQETLEEMESNPNIIAVGYQDDVRPYFAISNALVFPSYREGFPNVVMQAGAMGLPSIVSNINGCNEIIKEEKNGLIIPVKNTEALYKAMLRLINDPILNTKLASNARPMIVKRYEQSKVWDALLKEYEKLLCN